jgi:hypothetical protein
VLAQRLRELEQAAVIRRRKLPPPAGSWIYELTDWGHELKPIALALGTWALRSESFPRDAPVGTDSVILALGTFFDPDTADDLSARFEIRLGENVFHAHIADRRIDVDRGPADHPDAVIETDPPTLAALIRKQRRLADALRDGDVTIDGDEGAVAHFLGLFPQPA